MDTALTIIDDCNGEEGLRQNSDSAAPKTGTPRRASVLIPLVRQDASWHVQYIRRAASTRDRHSGQVAFPGGACEEHDASREFTALREAYEEIGLPPETVRVLAQLEDYTTISNFEVSPFVGIVERPFEPSLQLEEVARTFTIPLDWLRDRNNFTRRARADMDPASARRHPVIVYEHYDGELLWGATARMTLNFLHALDEERIVLPSL